MANEATKKEIIEKLDALRAGLVAIAAEDDLIKKENLVLDNEFFRVNSEISATVGGIRDCISGINSAQETIRGTEEEIGWINGENTPLEEVKRKYSEKCKANQSSIQIQEESIRKNKESITLNEKVLQKKRREYTWNFQWGDLKNLLFALMFLFVAFACAYWCVISIITDMGELSGLEKVSAWMAKSKGPIHWIQHLYYVVDKKVVYEVYAPNAGSLTKQEWKWFSLAWILPAVLAIVFLILGIIFLKFFFKGFDFKSFLVVKSNKIERLCAKEQIRKLNADKQKLEEGLEKLKAAEIDLNSSEYQKNVFSSENIEKERGELKAREKCLKECIEYMKVREKELRDKVEPLHKKEETLNNQRGELMKKQEELKKRFQGIKEYYKRLKNKYESFLHLSHWKNVDIIRELIDQQYARDINEAVNKIKDEKDREKFKKEIVQEIRGVGQRTVQTLNSGMRNIYNVMMQGFSVVHKDLIDARLENLKVNQALLRSSQRQEQLRLMELETQKALLAKANETSEVLARNAQDISRITSWSEYAHQQRIRAGV